MRSFDERSSSEPHLVKPLRNYTVDEIARLTSGAQEHGPSVAAKAGLTSIDDKRPTLVRGQTLFHFLQERRQRSKRPCPPGFLDCLPCRAPKVPVGRKAELVVSHLTSGNLRGRCPACGRLMHRRVSLGEASAARGIGHHNDGSGPTHKRDNRRPCESDSRKDDRDHGESIALKNERTKRRYITWLKETQGFSEAPWTSC